MVSLNICIFMLCTIHNVFPPAPYPVPHPNNNDSLVLIIPLFAVLIPQISHLSSAP